jgi:hypothetical protein
MVIEFVGLIAGFGKSLIDNSKWFLNLLDKKVYSRLFRYNTKSLKNIPDDDFEFAYRILYFNKKMVRLAIMEITTLHFLIMALLTLIIVAALIRYVPSLKIYNVIIPQWGLFIIGYIIGLIYMFVFRNIRIGKSNPK